MGLWGLYRVDTGLLRVSGRYVGLIRGLCRVDSGYIGFIGIILGYRAYEQVIVGFYALPFCVVRHKPLLESRSTSKKELHRSLCVGI